MMEPTISLENLIGLGWPFLGLIIGVLGLFSLKGKSIQNNEKVWFLPLFAYMLHQFEEHGIDFKGEFYSFQRVLCSAFSLPPVGREDEFFEYCPASKWVIFAVNCGTIWVLMFACGYLIQQNRFSMVKASTVGVMIVNTIVHIRNFLTTGSYNSGLVTSLLLFFPLSIYLIRRESQRIPGKLTLILFKCLIMGVLLHAILLSSLFLTFKYHMFSEFTLSLIQLLNGILPVILDYFFR